MTMTKKRIEGVSHELKRNCTIISRVVYDVVQRHGEDLRFSGDKKVLQ
jgi:hypothetical protein